METIKHTGFDLFFNNLSNKKAKILVQALNGMNRTMNGYPLKFKLNRKHPRYMQHQAGATVITTRYNAVIGNAADLMLGLEGNRKVGEGFASAIGGRVTYEGSEFYAEEVNVEKFAKDIKDLVEEAA